MSILGGFGVIGGDMRQLFMSKSILKDGNNVRVFGIDSKKLDGIELSNISIEEVIDSNKYIILPLPVTRDKKTLNAPFSNKMIEINNYLIDMLKNKIIFCGMSNLLYMSSNRWKDLNIKDYYSHEEFEILNAIPTAEGSIQIAISEFSGTINSSRCLVLGYGRVGKVLSKLLKDMGADVTVSARNNSDLAWIQVMGYKDVNTNYLPDKLDYDLIFNTVPFKILDYRNLFRCSSGCIIIDLASKPGGVDLDAAQSIGIKAIHALGLPGRFSPMTSGEIVKKIIYKIIEEEKL